MILKEKFTLILDFVNIYGHYLDSINITIILTILVTARFQAKCTQNIVFFYNYIFDALACIVSVLFQCLELRNRRPPIKTIKDAPFSHTYY